MAKIDKIAYNCDYCDYSQDMSTDVFYCGLLDKEIETNDPETNKCPLPDATKEQIDYFMKRMEMTDKAYLEYKRKSMMISSVEL